MRSAYLKPAVAVLADRGVDVVALFAEAGMPAWTLRHEEALFSLHQITRFLEVASRLSGMPHLGFIAGQQALIDDLGIAGRLLRRGTTLDEGFATAFAINDAFSSGETSWLARHGDRVEFCRRYIERPRSPYKQSDQYTLGLLIAVVRLAEPAWTPDEIRLRSPHDEDLLRSGLLGHAHVAFDCEATTVTFPSMFLARRLAAPTADGSLSTPDLQDWLDAGPARDFTGSVQQLIATLMPTSGHPRVGLAARALGVSVRTFQRRLAESRLSFESLVRTDRLDRAAHLLESTRTTVLDIALELGYSDHAHFTRAFRRWTGLPPLAYRRSAQSRSRAPLASTGVRYGT